MNGMSPGKENYIKYRKGRGSCIDCGNPITLRPDTKRCRGCATKKLWRTGKLKNSCFPQGKEHKWWKGGRKKNVQGYILIYKPGYPRAIANYVLEHILIWETIHGKPLPKGWIIHHLNGIPSDNRIRNLVALPNKKHYLVLQAKAKRIQELEALLNHQGQFF